MTTAHRPTWKAAVGRTDEGGWSAGGARGAATSALDAPAHTVLKTRTSIVDRRLAVEQSLRELQQAEEKAGRSAASSAPWRRPAIKDTDEAEQLGRQRLLQHAPEVDVDDVAIRQKYDDEDVDRGGGSDSDDNDNNGDNAKKKSNGEVEDEEESDLDRSDDDDDDDDESASSDDDEDEEAALQAELAKIRAERDQAKQREQDALDREEQAKQEEAALLGNPLLNPADPDSSSLDVGKKRRWNDDVVFRNQARGEPAPQKRFINDTVRNDFHRRFLNKFIR